MADDTTLVAIQDLEVGDLEKTIGEIEEIRHSIEKMSDDSPFQLAEYRAILEEKLPKLLSNITCLGRYIPFLIGESNWNYLDTEKILRKELEKYYSLERASLHVRNEITRLSGISSKLFSPRKVGFGLHLSWSSFDGGSYNLDFHFDNNSFFKRLTLIDLYDPETSKDNIQIISAGTVDGFVRDYTNSIEEISNTSLAALPHLLNKIPSLIVDNYNAAYKRISQDKSTKFKELSNSIQELNGLKVTDFK